MNKTMNAIINNTNSVAINKGLDFFNADRQLKVDVLGYVSSKVWTKAVKMEYEELINAEWEKVEAQKKAMEALVNTDRYEESQKLYESVRKDCLAAIADFEADRDAYIDAQVKWEKTQNHKTLAKALKKIKDGESKDTPEVPMIEFFKAYGLDISNTVFLAEILASAGERDDWDKFVETDGVDMTSFNTTNFVDKAYKKAYTYMVRAGIIKAVDVPQIIREKYYEKLRIREERRSKKGKKNNKKDNSVVVSAEDVA